MRHKLVRIAAVALTLGLATTTYAQNGNYGARDHFYGNDRSDRNDRYDRYGSRMNAQERIRQGQESGELTPREVAMLQRQMWRVERMRRQAAEDGWSSQDRMQVRFAEAQLNQRIWQLKHNDVRVTPY